VNQHRCHNANLRWLETFDLLQVKNGEVLYNLWVYCTYIHKILPGYLLLVKQAINVVMTWLRVADDATTFWCHKNFISTYCSPDHIQRFLKRMKESDSDNPNSSGSSSKRLRSSTEGMFNFREHCLFYGEKCQVIRPQKIPNRWREAYLCRRAEREGQISFKESVIRHAERRSDNWEMTSRSEHTLPSHWLACCWCSLSQRLHVKVFF